MIQTSKGSCMASGKCRSGRHRWPGNASFHCDRHAFRHMFCAFAHPIERVHAGHWDVQNRHDEHELVSVLWVRGRESIQNGRAGIGFGRCIASCRPHVAPQQSRYPQLAIPDRRQPFSAVRFRASSPRRRLAHDIILSQAGRAARGAAAG